MKDLLDFIIRGLVENQGAVAIDESTKDGNPLLTVRVAPDEVGKIIGRQGRTVKALRAVMAAADRKSGHRTSVEIAEP
ncbi:MAG: KH domain-containing protein [Deltaproteobacteria bacterium]